MQVGKYLGWLKVGVFGAVLALALAGCTEPTPTGKLPDPPSSAASSATDSSDAPTTSAAPTTTYTPEEQAVIDQYKGFYNVPYQLSAPTDDEIRSAYSALASPELIENRVAVFRSFEADGKAPGGHVTFGAIEVVISGTIATTVECRDGTTELLVSISDGQTISHGSPGTRIDGELRQSDSGGWLVWGATVKAGGC